VLLLQVFSILKLMEFS